FNTNDAGENIPVEWVDGYDLTGDDKDNYHILPYLSGVTATIRPKPLGLTGVHANDKDYDGDNTVRVDAVGVTPALGQDEVHLARTQQEGRLASKDVGTHPVTSIRDPFSLYGKDAHNYTVKQPQGLSATIRPK